MKQKKKKFKMWNKLLAFLGMFVMLTGCLAGTVQAVSYEAGKTVSYTQLYLLMKKLMKKKRQILMSCILLKIRMVKFKTLLI